LAGAAVSGAGVAHDDSSVATMIKVISQNERFIYFLFSKEL
jgi:hypothetical protein